MTEPSQTPDERARKMYSILLQRMQGSASAIAAAMGVSESTVSRLKTEHAETLCQIMAHAGLKIVDVTRTCVPTSEIELLRRLYARTSAPAPGGPQAAVA